MKIDCTTCKYGYEDERLGIPMCHHPKRFSEDCVNFNMYEEKEIKESEKPINLDDAMKELDEKIALVKERGTWDGVDVDKYMDDVRGREPEKPMNPDEDFRGEMREWVELMVAASFPEQDNDFISEEDYRSVIKQTARHFYELGCRRTADKYDEIEYNRQRAEESVPNDLEEAAGEYAEKHGFRVPYDGSDNFYDDIDVKASKEGFIAGAKWQENKDQETIKLAEDHAFLAGADWQKEQMMEEAVEGEITKDNRGNNVVRAGVFNKDFEYGDKVRVIVLSKED